MCLFTNVLEKFFQCHQILKICLERYILICPLKLSMPGCYSLLSAKLFILHGIYWNSKVNLKGDKGLNQAKYLFKATKILSLIIN